MPLFASHSSASGSIHAPSTSEFEAESESESASFSTPPARPLPLPLLPFLPFRFLFEGLRLLLLSTSSVRMISLMLLRGKRAPSERLAPPGLPPYTHRSFRQYARGLTLTRPERVCTAESSAGVSRRRMYKDFCWPGRALTLSMICPSSASCWVESSGF